MASLSLSPQFETNAISNGKQLKSAKAHGKNYIKVTPLLVRHLLHNRLLRKKKYNDELVLRIVNQADIRLILFFHNKWN